MKEIPILFSTAMGQAILEGRKSQTRRIITPQPATFVTALSWKKYVSHCPDNCSEDDHVKTFFNDKCRYGKPGDLLWVRETFRKYCKVDEFGYTRYDQEVIEFAADNPPMINECDGDGCTMFKKDGSEKFIPWQSSIHMPKAIARIWLQVTDVRVERLHDISEDDAKAEGVESCKVSEAAYLSGDYREWFKELWQKINDSDSWLANPWVWVISFKILSTTGKPK